MADRDEMETEADSFYKAYEGYEKTLRTWFVAYGIGGPVLLLTNESMYAVFNHSARGRLITILFLVGGGVQVLLAIINKMVAWANFYAETRPVVQSKRRFRVASWISEQYWIDGIADIVSLLLFGWATWAAFVLVTAAA